MHPLLLTAALVLAACGGADAPEPVAETESALEVVTDEPDVPEGAPALEAAPVAADTVDLNRPATATRMVNIEGDDYPMDVKLFETMSFPVNFSTYVPANWQTHVVSTPGGMAVQLQMELEAGIDIFAAYDQSGVMASWEQARDAAAAEGDVTVLEGANLPEWASVGYVWYNGGKSGVTYVVEHAGTMYHLSESAPVEYGDGFAPRVELVLNEWRWLDDGTSL